MKALVLLHKLPDESSRSNLWGYIILLRLPNFLIEKLDNFSGICKSDTWTFFTKELAQFINFKEQQFKTKIFSCNYAETKTLQ